MKFQEVENPDPDFPAGSVQKNYRGQNVYQAWPGARTGRADERWLMSQQFFRRIGEAWKALGEAGKETWRNSIFRLGQANRWGETVVYRGIELHTAVQHFLAQVGQLSPGPAPPDDQLQPAGSLETIDDLLDGRVRALFEVLQAPRTGWIIARLSKPARTGSGPRTRRHRFWAWTEWPDDPAETPVEVLGFPPFPMSVDDQTWVDWVIVDGTRTMSGRSFELRDLS